jgi:hypothetical protein
MGAGDRLTSFRLDEAAFRRILTTQVRCYRQLDVQDLYKLIFQASRGSEHAVSDRIAARRWLSRELLGLADGPEEPIVDPISPHGRIVRINLRPYLAAKQDVAELLEAFVRTAHAYRGTEEDLRRYWRTAEEMAAEGLLPFAGDALRGFFAGMKAQGFPAVHHSDTYTRIYRPAYRVVLAEFLTQMTGPMPTV